MQIIEIIDPSSVIDKDNIAVGIDFGTTNSVIAIAQDNNLTVIKDALGRELIPSILSLIKDQIVVAQVDNQSIFSIKRLLGKSWQEINTDSILLSQLAGITLDDTHSKPVININGNIFTLPAIVAEIFKYLKHQAEYYLKHTVTQAVITVPAYFDDIAKSEIMLAAQIAGLKVLRVMNEPTAAAYAYGLDKQIHGTYLIYDLGGGTFDVSLLNLQKGVLQVIATSGHNRLGGDDVDHKIADYIYNKFLANSTIAKDRELWLLAKSLKELLTTQDLATLKYKGYQLSLSKEEMNFLIKELISTTIDITYQLISEQEIEDLLGIILVGGSSRLPLVKELLNNRFNVPILDNIDPDRAVAYGAALQAKNLTCGNQNILIDVLPLSLGVELYGGVVEKLLLRNSPLPISASKEFTTAADYQTTMQIHILQGEREMVADCRSLAYFELKNLPVLPAGMVKIEVTFAIDINNILSISAIEKSTNLAHSLTIKPTYGLNQEEIDQILTDAYKNANEDHQKRLITETKLEAQTLLRQVNSILHEENEEFDTDYVLEIKKAINILTEDIILSEKEYNRDNMINNIERLKVISTNLLQDKMSRDLLSSLKGKKIDNLNF